MPFDKHPDSETLVQADKRIKALKQQAHVLAHSVETVRQQTLAQSKPVRISTQSVTAHS